MIVIVQYPSNSQYRRFLSRDFSEREQAVLFRAENIATEQHFEQKRRDGTETIRHPRAVAMAARDLHLPAVDIATAWLHDVSEEGWDHLTPLQIGLQFDDPIAGRQIAFNLDVLTHRINESVEAYYGRIIMATAEYWRNIVIKMLDRWHFHICPYGGAPEREQAKALETLGLFSEMCFGCIEHIPADFLPTYIDLVGEVHRLARTRLRQLESMAPRVLP